jgi:hypothetical protein
MVTLTRAGADKAKVNRTCSPRSGRTRAWEMRKKSFETVAGVVVAVDGGDHTGEAVGVGETVRVMVGVGLAVVE